MSLSIEAEDRLAPTPAQCRAARGLLGWTQTDLSDRAGVARTAVIDYEAGTRKPQAKTLARIRACLEQAGLTLVNGADGAVGVILRPR